MISGKMIFFFFSVFGCILENAPENIQLCCVKDRAEEMRGETCVFGKCFMKKKIRKPFSKF